MLGTQIFRDFQVDQVCSTLPTMTHWGQETFRKGFTTPGTNSASIKQKQLPLLALGSSPSLRDSIRSELETLKPISSSFQSNLSNSDPMIQESFQQVFWAKDSFGASFNTHSSVLNGLVFWKSIVLPGFAILTPLLGLIIPYFVLKFIRADMNVSEYLEHVKVALMKQISIPSFLKAKGEGDTVGYILESLFVGLTLVMFISGLWNQVKGALHLRSIWSEIEKRGSEFQTLVRSAQSILAHLQGLPLKKQRALRDLLKNGSAAVLKSNALLNMKPAAAFGALWNDETYLDDLVAWIGQVDVLTAIVAQQDICFPTALPTRAGAAAAPILDIKGVYHPMLPKCVRNDSCISGHVILTGPNRGGKSTYCRSIGLAVLTAQSWGFAWATSMRFTPFGAFWSALEPNALLGQMSTFEAEIEFAKQVLALSTEEAPAFVMMDEIFHSTNAMDGLAASKVFLEQLYAKQGTLSLISTHYKDLAICFSGRATTLQMIAEGDVKLTYTYKVGEGISEKSSVMEILEERGLLRTAANK